MINSINLTESHIDTITNLIQSKMKFPANKALLRNGSKFTNFKRSLAFISIHLTGRYAQLRPNKK